MRSKWQEAGWRLIGPPVHLRSRTGLSKYRGREAGIEQMNGIFRKCFIGLAGLTLLAPQAVAADADFTLREHLGRDWHNERVTFPLAAAQLVRARAGAALVDADERALAYQLSAGRAPAITFIADLPAYATRSYRFSDHGKAGASDLQTEETATAIRIFNPHTGIEIRKQLAAGQGPIARIRLPSDAWIGDSRLETANPPSRYSVEWTDRGPVMAGLRCHAEWADGSSWDLKISLDAGEPTLVIQEIADVRSERARFRVDLARDFQPSHLFYRRGWQDGFRFTLAPLAGAGPVFRLEPWQNWFRSTTEGASFSLCRLAPGESVPKAGSDLLAIGAGHAGLWVDPATADAKRQPPEAELTRAEDGFLSLDFVLKSGQREWLISGLDAAASLAMNKDRYLLTPPPYQAVIKHGQFPLDPVKDLVLAWDHAATSHPRMLVTREAIIRFRATLDAGFKAAWQKRIPALLKRPIGRYDLDEPITAWCATGDETIGRHLIDGAERHLQEALDCFLTQPVPYGSAPHMTPSLGTAMTLCDAALGTGLVTPERRARMLARAAFIAYAIDRPDYWSPERGYHALPNMTTSVHGYLAAAAALVGSHPAARDWSTRALATLTGQLRSWSDANGGWLEAPHYAGVSYDVILAACVMAKNAGFSDALDTEPGIKAVPDWLGKISTPPDVLANNQRHLPHLGHTYLLEPTGQFGTLAWLFRERDPAFAARMQWLWLQQGAFGQPGIGGGYPAMAGFRAVMADRKAAATPPAWGSEWFPKTGVVLRSGFPDPRETQLCLIAGEHRSHYNDDSGSFSLWGKGRSVVDFFGYGQALPAADHSLLDSPRRGKVMNVKTFATTADFDYVDARADGWRRQIAMIKDPDPLGPNYFLLSDSLDQPATAVWRLWTAAETVTLKDRGATITGSQDVATDVFFASPAAPLLSTESRTRQAGAGRYPDGTIGAMAAPRIALLAKVPEFSSSTVVLHPRLKSTAAPEIVAIAGGRGAKIRHAAGTDYVFLSALPIKFAAADGINFEGTAGAILLRGERTILALGAPGIASARGRSIESDHPKSQSW